jgi:hypothetical protein
MRRTFLYSFIICVSIFARSEASYGFDWGPFSLRLKEGMTEQQAINAVGYQPNKVEQKTCGQDAVGGAWACRVLTFGDVYGNLRILERRAGSSWVVNSWTVFP